MRYFIGLASQLGTVSASPAKTFAELCEFIAKPYKLAFSREAFFALPDKDKSAPLDQDRVKRAHYVTPAVFRTSPSPRHAQDAMKCNLIALDIDDAREAKRLLAQDWSRCLQELGYIVWHTVRSTPEKPRLRVLVAAENIPVTRYVAAARTIAAMLGMGEVTHLVTFHAVQPMFLPTIFADSTTSPVVTSNPDGDDFTTMDIAEQEEYVDDVTPRGPDSEGVENLAFLRAPLEGVSLDDVRGALEKLDPDMPMQTWIEMAGAIKHQFDSEEGFQLWDEWSKRGKKYTTLEDTRYRWNSLKAQPSNRVPVTIRSLFKLAQARGWVNTGLAKRQHAEMLCWLQNPARTTEEMLDHGVKRIAKIGPILGALDKKILLTSLKESLDSRGMKIPLPDIRKEIHRIEVDAAKTSGLPTWAKGLCYITATHEFFSPSTNRRFTPEVIDLMHSTPKVGDDQPMRPRDYLIHIAQVNQVENLRYEPVQSARFFSIDNVPYVNTYRPSYAPPDVTRSDEAGEIWMDHMKKLIAEEEHRQTLMDFIAYMVQSPGKKIRWAPLVQSAEGAGKSTLAVAAKAILGRGNVSKLKGYDLMVGNYNDWSYGKQLVVIEEIRVIGQNRHAVMDKIKTAITDDDLDLHEKFESHRTVENTTNYIMFTNFQDALAVSDDGRRYFVVCSPLQTAADIEAIGGVKHFNRVYGMIRENPGGLRAFFQTWPISPKFQPDGRAPVTRYLHELAENSATPLTMAIKHALEDEPHPLVRKDIVSIGCLRGCLDGGHLQDFSDQAMAACLRELGWRKFDRVMVDGAKHQIWLKGMVKDPRASIQARVRFL